MRRITYLLILFTLMLLLWHCFFAIVSADQVIVGGVDVCRVIPLTIKVAFMGSYFDPEIIDTDSLRRLLPEEKICRILTDNNVTGVVYRFNYEFIFAASSFKSRFIKFLKSIEERAEIKNPWFYAFEFEDEWFVAKPMMTSAALYDARAVERWLMEHLDEVGGLPENGYMFIIADLRDGLPSADYREIRGFLTARTLGLIPPIVTAHYYRLNYSDLDRGYRLRYREFAVGWGGSERLWFLDLSAGPTFVSMWYDLPIQVVMADQSIDPYTDAGSQWLTELLADHIREFVYNLAAPDFVYDPPWSERFVISVTVIDCRDLSEREIVPIRKTVNATLIEDVVSCLLPLSKIDVEVRFLDIADFPELGSLLKRYSSKLNSWMHKYLFSSPMNESYIDAQPIYEYLKENLGTFLPEIVRREDKYVIPVIAFALSGDYHFMFKYKWLILRRSPETSTIWGAAFKEFALIGLSQKDFLYGEYVEPKQEGKGVGFTQTIIHEVGHMLGLAHPHVYGDLGDFVCSAMSYFSYEYGFSTFDRDAIARIHTNKFLMKIHKVISEIEAELPLKSDTKGIEEVRNRINNIRRMLKSLESEYLRMNYTGAWKIALDTYKVTYEVAEIVKSLPQIPENIAAILSEKEMEIIRLNQNYSILTSKYDEITTKYRELMDSYTNLSLRCETYLNEISLLKSLTIVLIAIICSLMTTTIYLLIKGIKRKFQKVAEDNSR